MSVIHLSDKRGNEEKFVFSYVALLGPTEIICFSLF